MQCILIFLVVVLSTLFQSTHATFDPCVFFSTNFVFRWITNAAWTLDINDSNPPLTLVVGYVYQFQNLDAALHPMYIKTAPGIGTGSQYNTGVVNQGTDIISFTPQSSLLGTTLYYQCSNHVSMVGTINFVSPCGTPTTTPATTATPATQTASTASQTTPSPTTGTSSPTTGTSSPTTALPTTKTATTKAQTIQPTLINNSTQSINGTAMESASSSGITTQDIMYVGLTTAGTFISCIIYKCIIRMRDHTKQQTTKYGVI